MGRKMDGWMDGWMDEQDKHPLRNDRQDWCLASTYAYWQSHTYMDTNNNVLLLPVYVSD